MAQSFIAYIDEAGDEGLTGKYRTPANRGGSSHSLTRGTMWRYSRDLDAVRWARAIVAQLPEQKRDKPLHFMNVSNCGGCHTAPGTATACTVPGRGSFLGGVRTQSGEGPHLKNL